MSRWLIEADGLGEYAWAGAARAVLWGHQATAGRWAARRVRWASRSSSHGVHCSGAGRPWVAMSSRTAANRSASARVLAAYARTVLALQVRARQDHACHAPPANPAWRGLGLLDCLVFSRHRFPGVAWLARAGRGLALNAFVPSSHRLRWLDGTRWRRGLVAQTCRDPKHHRAGRGGVRAALAVDH